MCALPVKTRATTDVPLSCFRFSQQFVQAGHALTRGGLRCSRATPVRLELERAGVSVFPERAKLARPVDDALPHRRPLGLAVAGIADRDDVLAVQMADAILGKLRVAVRIRVLASRGGIAWLPAQHQG